MSLIPCSNNKNGIGDNKKELENELWFEEEINFIVSVKLCLKNNRKIKKKFLLSSEDIFLVVVKLCIKVFV